MSSFVARERQSMSRMADLSESLRWRRMARSNGVSSSRPASSGAAAEARSGGFAILRVIISRARESIFAFVASTDGSRSTNRCPQFRVGSSAVPVRAIWDCFSSAPRSSGL
jgi:hypothetical protein